MEINLYKLNNKSKSNNNIIPEFNDYYFIPIIILMIKLSYFLEI